MSFLHCLLYIDHLLLPPTFLPPTFSLLYTFSHPPFPPPRLESLPPFMYIHSHMCRYIQTFTFMHCTDPDSMCNEYCYNAAANPRGKSQNILWLTSIYMYLLSHVDSKSWTVNKVLLRVQYVCGMYVCVQYVCVQYVCVQYVCVQYVCVQYVCGMYMQTCNITTSRICRHTQAFLQICNVT